MKIQLTHRVVGTPGSPGRVMPDTPPGVYQVRVEVVDDFGSGALDDGEVGGPPGVREVAGLVDGLGPGRVRAGQQNGGRPAERFAIVIDLAEPLPNHRSDPRFTARVGPGGFQAGFRHRTLSFMFSA